MITLRAIAGRICLTTIGTTTCIRNDFTLIQAMRLQKELGELIAELQQGTEQVETLPELIEKMRLT